MDNAEKWKEFFEKANYYDLNYNREISAITDFKQSLKELIEAEIDGLDFGGGNAASEWMEEAYKKVLTLIDKCEPKQ